MPLSDEVVDFIEKGVHSDMTDKDIEEWCDNNLYDLVGIYEKYRGTYRNAEMTMFFLQTVYGRDDVMELVDMFVANQ
tara:strand:- start:3606 stop:3836 length:231 start_codon:yes stop_codon:yes gene_type:complete